MEAKKQNKAKLFDIRCLPQDLSRLVILAAKPFLRVKKYDINGQACKKKLRGGAVIVSNHVGLSDPIILESAFICRRMFFLAGEIIMKNPIIAFLLRGAGCIKIDRGISDIEAIRKAVSVLKDGRLLAVFPQGGIRDVGSVSEIKSGAILLAIQAGVPIIPAYSRKPKHWYSRRIIVVGDAIDPKALCGKKMPSIADINNTAETLIEKIEQCRMQHEKLTAR